MPRTLPRYDRMLDFEIASALAFVAGLERARAISVTGTVRYITLSHLELSYELAFLRVYLAWEFLLENCLIRLFCGYEHSGGQEPLKPGKSYYSRLADAEAYILGSSNYKLWHRPTMVISHSQRLLNNGRYEQTIASASSQLEKTAAVRHRIAHSQKHAQGQFDSATMSLAGKRYSGSRAGRFLRDWTHTQNAQARWISQLFKELSSLSHQLCN